MKGTAMISVLSSCLPLLRNRSKWLLADLCNLDLVLLGLIVLCDCMFHFRYYHCYILPFFDFRCKNLLLLLTRNGIFFTANSKCRGRKRYVYRVLYGLGYQYRVMWSELLVLYLWVKSSMCPSFQRSLKFSLPRFLKIISFNKFAQNCSIVFT